MLNLPDILRSLQGSYSGAFMLFWGSMVLACFGLWIFEARKNRVAFKIECALFWGFGAAMVIFAALRPIGIAPDDLAYLEIFKAICPSLECGKWMQSPRDWGWYSLVGLLKSFWPGPRTMLLVSAIALLIKLGAIFKLCRRPLVALVFFTGVFYQVQDLTAFRVSLSVSVFMVSIYLLSKRQRLIGSLAILLPGLFHQQAILSPLILVSEILKRRYIVFVVLTLAPICFLFLGLTFQAYMKISSFQDVPLVAFLLAQGLSSYIALGQAGAYENIRVMPYSYIPLILLIVYFAKDVFSTNNDLYRYCAMSLVIACWLAWVCAGWQEPQARFFEYFALPTVLLVGNFRNSLLSNLGVIMVAAVFALRYNVLHPLLIG